MIMRREHSNGGKVGRGLEGWGCDFIIQHIQVTNKPCSLSMLNNHGTVNDCTPESKRYHTATDHIPKRGGGGLSRNVLSKLSQ